MYNGFGKHHGGHHGGGGYYPYPMMIPQYQPSTIEVITTGDDICTACRAKTVTGPACDRCSKPFLGATDPSVKNCAVTCASHGGLVEEVGTTESYSCTCADGFKITETGIPVASAYLPSWVPLAGLALVAYLILK